MRAVRIKSLVSGTTKQVIIIIHLNGGKRNIVYIVIAIIIFYILTKKRSCREILNFNPYRTKQKYPDKYKAFWLCDFVRIFCFSIMLSIFGHKTPLAEILLLHFLLCGFLLWFSFKFLQFCVEKTMIFVYISSYRKKHKFFIYLI